MIEVGLSDKPVYRDGRTTDLTYAFVAVKNNQPEYNAVVYSVRRQTLKFYPNTQFWGITDTVLKGLGVGSVYDRAAYQGLHFISTTEADKVLEVIRGQRGVVVVPSKVFLKYDWNDAPRNWCRDRHPPTHGVPSSLPYFEGPRAT
jgi:hypothetical protein